MTLPFPLRSSPAPFKFQGEPRIINCYPEEIGQENRAPVAFPGIPGQVSFTTGLGAVCRALIWAPGMTVWYALAAQTVSKIATSGTATALTGIIAGNGPVIWDIGPERYDSAEVTISFASPGVVTWPNHRLSAGKIVRFSSTGELPTGILADTDYYVLAEGLTADTFEISPHETAIEIDRTLGSALGDMVSGGGAAAAFDGVTNQTAAASASLATTANGYVARQYTTRYIFDHAIVYGSNDSGFWSDNPTAILTFSGYNGVGFTTLGTATFTDTTNESAGRTIASTDLVNSYAYGWMNVGRSTGTGTAYCSELRLFGRMVVTTSGVSSGTITATRTDATRQIVIVSANAAYCIEDEKILRIIMPDDETVVSVTYLAARFVFGMASGRFFYSELNNARIIDELSYSTAEARPDGIVRAYAHGGELYLIGENTTEVWQPDSDSDVAYVPVGGTFIDKGCASAHSVVSFDNALHMLGHDGMIYRVSGYQTQRVSTHAVERAIKAVADKTTIKGYVDTDEGHSFYVLTCDQWTWVFDAATGVWHERKSLDRPDWRAWPYVSGLGKRIVGDKATDRLCYLDKVADEAGTRIISELWLPDVPGRLEHYAVEIDVLTGVGLNVASTAEAYDPKIMLAWSDDGGNLWADPREARIGRQGQYDTTVRFSRLGTTKNLRGRRYKITHSERTLKAFMLGDLQAQQVA